MARDKGSVDGAEMPTAMTTTEEDLVSAQAAPSRSYLNRIQDSKRCERRRRHRHHQHVEERVSERLCCHKLSPPFVSYAFQTANEGARGNTLSVAALDANPLCIGLLVIWANAKLVRAIDPIPTRCFYQNSSTGTSCSSVCFSWRTLWNTWSFQVKPCAPRRHHDRAQDHQEFCCSHLTQPARAVR